MARYVPRHFLFLEINLAGPLEPLYQRIRDQDLSEGLYLVAAVLHDILDSVLARNVTTNAPGLQAVYLKQLARKRLSLAERRGRARRVAQAAGPRSPTKRLASRITARAIGTVEAAALFTRTLSESLGLLIASDVKTHGFHARMSGRFCLFFYRQPAVRRPAQMHRALPPGAGAHLQRAARARERTHAEESAELDEVRRKRDMMRQRNSRLCRKYGLKGRRERKG